MQIAAYFVFACCWIFPETARADAGFYCYDSPFFAGASITQIVNESCTVQAQDIYFDTPLDATGMFDADYIYLDWSEPHTPGGTAEVGFFGSIDGDPDDPFDSGQIELQYAVTTDTPVVFTGSETADLTNGTTVGTIGGTAKFCVGSFFSGDSFEDDGCAAGGGTLYSVPLAELGSVSFYVHASEIDVWDEIDLSGGADFGTIGQTFSQAPETPEPSTLLLVLAATLAGRRIAIRWSASAKTDGGTDRH